MGATTSKQNPDLYGINEEYISNIQKILVKDESILDAFPSNLKQTLEKVYQEYQSAYGNNAKMKFLVSCVKFNDPTLFLNLMKMNDIRTVVSLFLEFYLKNWSKKEDLDEQLFDNLLETILLNDMLKKEYLGDIEENDLKEYLGTLNDRIRDENEAVEYYNKNMFLQSIIAGALSFGLFSKDREDINTKYPILKEEMDPSLILFIKQKLPLEISQNWILKFDSNIEGQSWFTFQTKLTSCEKCLIFITEKHSKYKFGAYSNSPFKRMPKFFGSPDDALFTIHPKLRWYPTTSYNSNYKHFMYQSQTLVNGLGMGGQLDYFGLYIDPSFNSGHSKAHPKCSTFNSPQLSNNEYFEIERVQVWSLKELEQEEENSNSILDDNEAAAMLEMAGKKLYSKDLRDPTLDLE